jgi:hypothetical protein
MGARTKAILKSLFDDSCTEGLKINAVILTMIPYLTFFNM